jgi:hypothetical protein
VPSAGRNLDFLLGRTQKRLPAAVAPPSGLLKNYGTQFRTLLSESLTKFRAFVWVYVGLGWEQKEVDGSNGKLMRTKGI